MELKSKTSAQAEQKGCEELKEEEERLQQADPRISGMADLPVLVKKSKTDRGLIVCIVKR